MAELGILDGIDRIKDAMAPGDCGAQEAYRVADSATERFRVYYSVQSNHCMAVRRHAAASIPIGDHASEVGYKSPAVAFSSSDHRCRRCYICALGRINRRHSSCLVPASDGADRV